MTADIHNWKHGDLDDLLARAVDVTTSPAVRRGQLSAAEAAHSLVGVMCWIQRKSSFENMQTVAAQLVRYEAAWSSSFGSLPHDGAGVVDEYVGLLAVFCRGILELAGAMNLRAALSFWATESDPAVWRKLFA